MNQVIDLIYVNGNMALTLTNMIAFMFVLEFVLSLINILRGLNK